MKSIKLKDYFEIVKPKYIILKIIPHNSIRNYDSSNIAKAIQSMYKSLRQQIRIDHKKLKININYKLSFFIDINKRNVNFYFLVPERYLNLFKEKITQTWEQVKIEQVDNIKNFSKAADSYELKYKKEDALSLRVDKKSNILLNNLLNVIDIMKENDRIGIFYNFSPRNQLGWKQEYKRTIDKFKNNEVLEKRTFNKNYIGKKILQLVISILNSIVYGLNTMFNDNNNALKEMSITNLFNIEKRELSKSTIKKENNIVLDAEMIVLSDSIDKTRKSNNALSILESYGSISDDNKLIYRKMKKRMYNVLTMPIATKNTVSTDECQNFLQLPGRDLLDKFKIEHGTLLENNLCEELRTGYIRLGTHDFKGSRKIAYMSNNKDLANLGLVALGGQGCGKTEYFKNYSKDVTSKDENLIILDFIKNCEFSNDVERVVDKDKLIILDLSDENSMQGLGYNEIKFSENMSKFEVLETANMIAQQDLSLIDAINADGAPLTSRMRRYLSAAANIVHLKENKSLRDVINVLQDFRIRKEVINSIPTNLRDFLDDEVNALQELNEVKEIKNKETKEVTFEVVGTKDSKIEHILDRINLLKEDFKLKYMFNMGLENNIDFVEELEKGKAILVKIPEHKFQSKYVKNTIVTYFITKIWLACQLRGKLHDRPLRTHLILDEIFQAPTSEYILQDILLQARKFQLKFVFSVHYLSKFKYIREALKASGASYMLLSGTDKNNFKELEEELQPFELQDLLNLPRFYSLNLIKTKQGFARFITKLPPKIIN
ncbi:hypothetical protein G8T71_06925 [Clostridium botulinum C/D]|uniref:hypothetical protein n=1 Tax=Clostridium botulinum TaxID=1491 RepID=UPI0004D8394B|nr:hypothetical protein [Clostridium botulinum]KEH96210.1 hypothetical protein Z953_p0278 [Clostridium botulinum D str. 16868]MCD3211087.1 hypothetical protein [Clostridium botulinum C/D]